MLRILANLYFRTFFVHHLLHFDFSFEGVLGFHVSLQLFLCLLSHCPPLVSVLAAVCGDLFSVLQPVYFLGLLLSRPGQVSVRDNNNPKKQTVQRRKENNTNKSRRRNQMREAGKQTTKQQQREMNTQKSFKTEAEMKEVMYKKQVRTYGFANILNMRDSRLFHFPYDQKRSFCTFHFRF